MTLCKMKVTRKLGADAKKGGVFVRYVRCEL